MTVNRDDAQAWRAVLDFAGHDVPLAVVARRINAIERAADEARERAVRAMRVDGWTWEEVGDALGTTHQAAMRRFKARGID